METKRHKNYKEQLFNHLHQQINDCLGCFALSETDRRDHLPSTDRPRLPIQEIVWLCEYGHHHTLDILTRAAWCDQERQFTAPSGLRCKPDIIIYDAHRNPCVFIEIKHKNAKNNTWQVAQEIGALWLELSAPPPGSFQKELDSSRPWWELISLPEGAKREMEVLTQLGAKLFGPREGTWGNIHQILNDDGSIAATTMEHSDPVINQAKFLTLGGYIWVNKCSISCEEAQLENAREERLRRLKARRRSVEEIKNRLGVEIFERLYKTGQQPYEFTVPIGTMEIHAKLALTELTQLDGARPDTIDVQKLVHDAAEEIKLLEADLDSMAMQRYPTTGDANSLSA